MKFFPLLFILTLIVAQPGKADGTLMGRAVVMSIETYNDPDAPIFSGFKHKSVVSDQVEFGLGNEGTQNDVDVVPILVDISERRIEIQYANAPPSELATASFNGYVLRFSAGCGAIKRGRVDAKFTNILFDNKRVRVDDHFVRLNVSSLRTNPGSKLAVDLEITDC